MEVKNRARKAMLGCAAGGVGRGELKGLLGLEELEMEGLSDCRSKGGGVWRVRARSLPIKEQTWDFRGMSCPEAVTLLRPKCVPCIDKVGIRRAAVVAFGVFLLTPLLSMKPS
jgi:hypothetical protein